MYLVNVSITSVAFLMPDGFTSTGNKEITKQQTSFHWYLLRVLFFAFILLLLDALFLLLGEDQGFVIAVDAIGVCIASIASMSCGETIDKKLVLLGFRTYKWIVDRGLVEVSYPDEEAKPRQRIAESRKPAATTSSEV